MVENGEKNFDKQLNRKSVSTILKDLIQHSQLEEKETDKDKILGEKVHIIRYELQDFIVMKN